MVVRRYAKKFYYWSKGSYRFGSSTDQACSVDATIYDVCSHYEPELEMVKFAYLDENGEEVLESETYYFGTVYKGPDVLKMCREDLYDKYVKEREMKNKFSVAEDVYLVTNTGKFYCLDAFDVAMDIKQFQRELNKRASKSKAEDNFNAGV